MSFDADTLFGLLPAVHRIRDAGIAAASGGLLTDAETAELTALRALPAPTVAEQERMGVLGRKATTGPLRALLTVLAGEIAVVEENLAQLYDDLFVETCADWVVPYLGDLLGSEPLHPVGRSAGWGRAEVAHTIAMRRRKGTAAVLEQLARDVTGWDARAVEFFRLLATTQHVNHVRPANATAALRDGESVQWAGSAFDPLPHTADVRRIGTGRGSYNIPNVGIFLWRIGAHRLRRSPVTPHNPADTADRRFRMSPLGNDVPLHTNPEPEDEITHIAEPGNVPLPITRRLLRRHPSRYYGAGRSLELHIGGTPVPPDRIVTCNLSDDGMQWAHDAPADRIAVDPELGRMVIGSAVAVTGTVRATFHYGAAGDLGGGEYERAATFEPAAGTLLRVPDDHAAIQDALDALAGAGTVEITDNGRYREVLAVRAGQDRTIELRAAPGRRPTLELTGAMTLAADEGGGVTVNGLVIAGGALVVPAADNALRRLRVVHTTLVPGRTLDAGGTAALPGEPSLSVERPDVDVAIEHSIVGALRIDGGSRAAIAGSVVDAGGPGSAAYRAPGEDEPPGGALALDAVTVVGTVEAVILEASNTILLGRVEVVRTQEGCVRFSFLPPDSKAPRRFRCQPEPGAGRTVPSFTSLRYGTAAYCQLAGTTPEAIRRGADDESEMGVHHFLYQSQREANLVARLNEYLRVGLHAGIIHAS